MAIEDIRQAIKLNPKDASLRKLFEEIKKSRAEHRGKEQATMSELFTGGMYGEKDGKIEKYDLPAFDPENAQVWMEFKIGHPE